MPKVFVSYRHEDSQGSTGRLCEHLSKRLGARRIFRDVQSLHPGIDFVDAITEAVSSCDVLIAVIGKQWLTLSDAGGRRRLDAPEDFVRREIELALQKKGIPVIPVLVDGASMPAEGDLPTCLSKLAKCQAVELTDRYWDADIRRLLVALSAVGSAKRPFDESRLGRWRSPSRLVPILLIVGVVVSLWLTYFRRKQLPPPLPLRPPVIGIVGFNNDTRGEESLGEAVTAKLKTSGDLHVAEQRTLDAVLSAAQTGDDLPRIAAAQGIDYLLMGEIVPGGLSLNVRVAATNGSRPIEFPIYGLAREKRSKNTREIAARIRGAMGLPAQDRVDLWAADFPTTEPAAYGAYILGLEALNGERYENAKSHFSAALLKDPNYVMASYRLAWAFALAGETDQALEEIRDAVAGAQGWPDREQQYLRAAELYFERRYEKAAKAYRDLIASYPREIEARQHLADILMEPGSYEEAVKWWKSIEKWEPREAGKNLGSAYLELGRYPEAVQKLEASAKKWPRDARVHGLLGNAYQARGDFERAAREYEIALTIDPHLYNIVILRALLEALRGQPDEAVRRLTPIVSDVEASAADRIDAGLELAYLLRAGGRLAEASRLLRDLQEDLRDEEIREAWALSLRAMCAMESRDGGNARALVQRALVRAPEGARTSPLFTRGLLELDAGSVDAARGTAEDIQGEIRKVPSALAKADRAEDKAAAYLLGMALLREGKPGQAILSLSEAVTLRGFEYRIYRLGLARAYVAAGRFDDALKEAEEATRRRNLYDPTFHLELDRNLALLLMAQVEQRMGRRESATEHAEQFLRAWKHADRAQPQVKEALQLVQSAALGRRKLNAGPS